MRARDPAWLRGALRFPCSWIRGVVRGRVCVGSLRFDSGTGSGVGAANHNPRVVVNGRAGKAGIPGAPVIAPRAAPPSANPAGEGGIASAPAGGPREPPRVVLDHADTPRVTVTPKVAGIAHVVLAVEDDGAPPLTSYRRVILRIAPGAAGVTR